MLAPSVPRQDIGAQDARAGIVRMLPVLRAYATSLARNEARAADLVQQAVLQALANLDKFRPGTNLEAWMFTILRNRHHADWRKRRREVELTDGCANDIRHSTGGEDAAAARLDYARVEQLLHYLPAEQRRALVLVAVEGRGYAEVAELLGCAEGTVKSRVNRARLRLLEMMDGYQLLWGAPDPEQRAGGDVWDAIVAAGALDDYAEEAA
jgi:RNA polymerase sigma-70 factor, ECF subfamily